MSLHRFLQSNAALDFLSVEELSLILLPPGLKETAAAAVAESKAKVRVVKRSGDEMQRLRLVLCSPPSSIFFFSFAFVSKVAVF